MAAASYSARRTEQVCREMERKQTFKKLAVGEFRRGHDQSGRGKKRENEISKRGHKKFATIREK